MSKFFHFFLLFGPVYIFVIGSKRLCDIQLKSPEKAKKYFTQSKSTYTYKDVISAIVVSMSDSDLINADFNNCYIQRSEKAGLRKERSCCDQIATLMIIVEQTLEWNTGLYMVFVDFEKAFDSIDRDIL